MKPAMLKPERKKLIKALPELLKAHGLQLRLQYSPMKGRGETDLVWHGYNDRFDCNFTVRPIIDEHPWLACCFNRPRGRTSNTNMKYRDIRDHLGSDVNPHVGKFNCHLFERCSVAYALEVFDRHLALMSRKGEQLNA